MSRLVIGIDPSYAKPISACVARENKQGIWHYEFHDIPVLKSSKEPFAERLIAISRNTASAFIEKLDFTGVKKHEIHIYVEEQFVARRTGNTALRLGMATASLMACMAISPILTKYEPRIQLINNQVWKRKTLPNASMDKDQIMAYLHSLIQDEKRFTPKKPGLMSRDSDAWDAFGICRYGIGEILHQGLN